MFKTVNEKQYLEIVDFARTTYRREVIKGSDVTAAYFDLELQRRRIREARARHQEDFMSRQESILFRLNLLIPNNNFFAKIFLDNCAKYLGLTDIEQIKSSFANRTTFMTEQWQQLIKYTASIYCIKEHTAVIKIEEILSFNNIYYPSLIEQQEVTGLSKR